jgi:pre-mRNA-processing factor 19
VVPRLTLLLPSPSVSYEFIFLFLSTLSTAGKTVVQPRPVAAASVPGLLSLLQSEWDALMLETFQLRQQLDSTRQELSQALYQHDAACRVIARLTRERDGARVALTQAQAAIARVGAGTAMEAPGVAAPPAADVDMAAAAPSSAVDVAGMTESVLAALKDKHKELSRGRKKRQVPADVAGAYPGPYGGAEASVSAKTKIDRLFPSSGNAAAAEGISALAIHPFAATAAAGDSSVFASLVLAGSDASTPSGGRALLFDVKRQRPVAMLAAPSGSSGRVSAVAFHPTRDVLFTAGSSGVVRVWADASNGQMAQVAVASSLQPHGAGVGVSALSVHPLGEYVATAAANGTWAFLDVAASRVLHASAPGDAGASFSTVSIHPDGLLVALGGADGCVRIVDLRSQAVEATLPLHTGGPVSAVAFSENGCFMASASAPDATVRITDLRSVQTVAELRAAEGAAGFSSLAFDHSGLFLAGGSARDGSVSVWGSQGWALSADNTPAQRTQLASVAAHAAGSAVSGVGFLSRSQTIASASLDGSFSLLY